MNSPLTIALFRVGNAQDCAPYASRLRELLFGIVGNGIAAGRELLQPAELRDFSVNPTEPATFPAPFDLAFLESADRILIVVIEARPLAQPLASEEQSITSALLREFDSRPIPAAVRVVEVMLKEPGSLYRTEEDPRLVRLGLADLDERDLRLAFLSLYVLHNTLHLMASGSDGGLAGAPKLFFSHAKRDGVPLTTAAGDWMHRIKGFEQYYDTLDLDLSGDLDVQLSSAIASAIVVVFRSDAFDDRYWCQKEVLWAEQNARPVIIVDARWQIEHSPSVINFDSMPGVRIPDGSIVRIFTAALVEALRVALFNARVQRYAESSGSISAVAIPRSPSVVSLQWACSAVRTLARPPRTMPVIVYPNPSLPQAMLHAATELAQASVAGCQVVSLDEFRLLT